MLSKNIQPLRHTKSSASPRLPTIYNNLGNNSVSAADFPPPQLRHLWGETLQAPEIGTLKRQSTDIWTTQYKVYNFYSWPREKTGRVKNAMFTKTIATYDPLRKIMKSAIGSISPCNVVKRFCKVGTRHFIWAPPPNANCPQADSIGTQDLLLHYHKQSLYRIGIPTLHLPAVHSQTKQSCQWADQVKPEPGPNPKM